MTTTASTNQPIQILAELGYTDPMDAARQQGRMLLLGRLARYEAEMQRLASKWQTTLAELERRYHAVEEEDFEADDDYLEWRWLSDAAEVTRMQLAALETD